MSDLELPSESTAYPLRSWTRHPKARRERVCDNCGGTIAKGERYIYVFNVYGAGWHDSQRFHDAGDSQCQ